MVRQGLVLDLKKMEHDGIGRPKLRYCTTPTSSASAMHHGGAFLDTVFGELWARLSDVEVEGQREVADGVGFEISCDAGILLRATVAVVAAARRNDAVIEDAEGGTWGAMVGEAEQMIVLGPQGRGVAMRMESCAEDERIREWIIGPDPDRSDMAICRRRLLLWKIVTGWARELGEQIAWLWLE